MKIQRFLLLTLFTALLLAFTGCLQSPEAKESPKEKPQTQKVSSAAASKKMTFQISKYWRQEVRLPEPINQKPLQLNTKQVSSALSL